MMRTLGFFLGIMFVFGGAYIHDKPATVASIVLQHGGAIGAGIALAGLVTLVLATDWQKTP